MQEEKEKMQKLAGIIEESAHNIFFNYNGVMISVPSHGVDSNEVKEKGKIIADEILKLFPEIKKINLT